VHGGRRKHLDGYIKWFYHVSHPLIVAPAPVPEYVVPRPVYQEILVEQEWARYPLNPLQVISSMRANVEHAMEIPEVVSNPLFFSILKGLGPSIACLTISRFHGGGV
jgi:hypothetical protein